MLPVFFYTSRNPHARYIRSRFELWGRPFRSSLLASFFLPFGVAMKGIHSTQLHCHISFLSFVRLTACFLSSRGRLLDSRKRRLFCLHIQHATRCLFERRTPVSSSEAAVYGFCLSISLLQVFSIRSLARGFVLGAMGNRLSWLLSDPNFSLNPLLESLQTLCLRYKKFQLLLVGGWLSILFAVMSISHYPVFFKTSLPN